MPAQCFVRTLGALLLFEVYGTLENRFFLYSLIFKFEFKHVAYFFIKHSSDKES